MKTLKDAIELIMAEPPEPHYPAYYADLLRQADVHDVNIGDTISRQRAIDEVNNLTYPSSLEDVKRILVDLPPAQPKISMLTVTVAPSPEDIERAVRKIHDAPVTVLPPAQPERQKGKWIKNDNGTYSCSVCQSWIPEEQRHYARYCLHCGADMRGETDDRH